MRDASHRPSVLVGMLHVGEPSVVRVRERIAAQVDVDVELLSIGHQTKWEAHRLLFGAFSSASDRHDALVKVDADMELVAPRLLHAIGALFRAHPELDHLILGVDDWFSGRRIQGMNAWRRGVHWTSPPPDLFTDLPTNTVRTKLKVMDASRPLVLHAADPSDEQAARYGLHRGLKAVATGRASRIGRLLDVVDRTEQAPERGRLIAVAAIGLALTDGTAARALLDAARDDGADLTVLRARLDDPDLCGDVRTRVALLAADAAPDGAGQDNGPAAGHTARPGTVARLVRTVRGGLARAAGRVASDEEARRAAWRDELLALLDEGQPSRSRA